MKFRNWLENLENDRDKIIPKGTILYHGTLESFDIRKTRTGGYDEIFWTGDNKLIARTYIPSKGGYLVASPENIAKDEKMLKSLGISNKVINYAWEKHNKGYEKLKYWDEQYKKYEKQFNQAEKEDNYHLLGDEFFEKWRQAEENKRKAQEEWTFAEKYILKFIIEKMKRLGYKLKDGTYRKVYYQGDTILPANIKDKGRLLIVTCLRDFKFYDMAKGREGDLMDLDYHKIKTFREIENNDYDGVIINDFAQSDYLGNVGHISYGFFKHSIKDLKIKALRDQTHPNDEEWD